jgi:hypothetical protein
MLTLKNANTVAQRICHSEGRSGKKALDNSRMNVLMNGKKVAKASKN